MSFSESNILLFSPGCSQLAWFVVGTNLNRTIGTFILNLVTSADLNLLLLLVTLTEFSHLWRRISSTMGLAEQRRNIVPVDG